MRFYEEILHTSRLVFGQLKRTYGEENICAYALYSDEGAMTVSTSINTTAHLKQAVASNPDDPQYYKWSPAEWKYEAVGDEAFVSLSSKLQQALDDLGSDKEFEKFRDELYETCVATLATLRSENLFDGAIVVFSVSSYEEDKKEISWIKRLNEPAEATEFKRWLAA